MCIFGMHTHNVFRMAEERLVPSEHDVELGIEKLRISFAIVKAIDAPHMLHHSRATVYVHRAPRQHIRIYPPTSEMFGWLATSCSAPRLVHAAFHHNFKPYESPMY